MRTLIAVTVLAAVAGPAAQQTINPRDLSGHWDRVSPIVSFAKLELVMTLTDPVVYARPWVSDAKRFTMNREKTRRWDEQIYCVPSEEFPFQKLIQSGNSIEP